MKKLIEELFDKLKTFATNMSKMEVKLEGVDKLIKDFKPFDNSDNEKKFEEIKPFDNSDNEKKFDAIDKGLESIEPFDNSKNEEMLAEIKESIPTIPEIPEAYDDAEIKKQIAEIKPFDDTEISKRIKNLEDVEPIEINLPEEYDDVEISKRIKNLEDVELPKEFDAEPLQQQINAMQKLHEKEIAEIKKAPQTIVIKAEIPEAKSYSGEEADRGAMILHENNLYVNLLNHNDSLPSVENKSYKLLIKAPKEPTHKGLYKADEKYSHGDMVMKDNATWFKTHSEQQELPSEGWKLMAKAVKGKKGDKGDIRVVEGYDEAIQTLSDDIEILKGAKDANSKD